MAWYEKIIGDLSAKKQWRDDKQRVHALPEPYRQTGAALERYLLNLGPTNDADGLIRMVSDLADLLEQAAANRRRCATSSGRTP